MTDSLFSFLREAGRWLLVGVLVVLLAYCVVLLAVGFLVALTAPIWIWWCI